MSPHDQNRRLPLRFTTKKFAAIGLTVAIGVVGITATTVVAKPEPNKSTREVAEPGALTVQVISPVRGEKTAEMVLPGDVQAFYEAPIYARVNGYLKQWYQDIGAHVKAGQVLASIDTPDLDQQLGQAQADLAQAKAREQLAALTAERWKALVASNSVAQQETDEKVGDLEAKTAARAAAQANLQRLQALESFKRIAAPFDGIVTARRTDIGDLINAGSGVGPALFAVADIHRMRIYVHVPQANTTGLTTGMTATLHLPEHPNQTFSATVETMSQAINNNSRTMLVELQADNSKDELKPGTYAQVQFDIPTNPNTLHLPSSALLFQRNGLQVAEVGPDNKVHMKAVTVGRDYGSEVEVTSGLSPDDKIVNSPPDSISEGDTVSIAKTEDKPVKVGANQ